MRIGRLNSSSGPEFVLASSDGAGWVSVHRLGCDAKDTPELIAALPAITDAAGDTEPDFPSDIELLCPIVKPGKILAIGHNYRAHIAEVGKTVPQEPYVFAKYPSSLCGPTEPIVVPRGLTAELDYECELAVIIGREGREIDTEAALTYVLGYAVANDVSARDLQRSLGQISLSKGIDTFCPLGPWVTLAHDGLDPQTLALSTSVNGEPRQDSSTSDMVFSIAELISYLSRFATLHPGDVILTGTPAGVGLGFTPPRFLSDGDVVECHISQLGNLRNVVSARPVPH